MTDERRVRMTDDLQNSVFLAGCPARLAIELIADKWAAIVVHGLGWETMRYGELRNRIEGISSKMLTQTLRNLEGNGLVERRAYLEVPVRVEYHLTALGKSLLEPISVLCRWAEAHGDEVVAGRSADSG